MKKYFINFFFNYHVVEKRKGCAKKLKTIIFFYTKFLLILLNKVKVFKINVLFNNAPQKQAKYMC